MLLMTVPNPPATAVSKSSSLRPVSGQFVRGKSV
jgi:hypothetical protein